MGPAAAHRALFRLSDDEKLYLRSNADKLVRESIWRVIAPELQSWHNFAAAPMAAQVRAREGEVNAAVTTQLPALLDELSQDLIEARFSFAPNQPVQIAPSKAMELIFSIYEPGTIGLIDYHGPQRFFQRENVQGINLNLDAHKQQQAQSALYNYGAKYTNVKTEMAASYVHEILTHEAGVPRDEQSTLTNTLKELFKTFFPDKQFSGPVAQVDGSLAFPVRMSDGTSHDLDDLSAGEKEVLYGYLRIRNSAPKHSIILLDEPELHLNPKLVRSLPGFYSNYLGKALDNQIWLVTHSDALIREIVGSSEFNVFHMTPGIGASFDENQAKALVVKEDAERAVVDMVGDLAAYRPGGKVVIFEGGGDSQFDVHMTGRLFPEFMEEVNAVSAGGKPQVRGLHSLLDAAASGSKIPFKVYSIADRDTNQEVVTSGTRLQWDCYHIENYLLNSWAILKVLKALDVQGFETESDVDQAVKLAARSVIPNVIRARITSFVGDSIVRSVNLRIDPNSADTAGLISEAASRSLEKIKVIFEGSLAPASIEQEVIRLRRDFDTDLLNGDWRKTLPGRDILTKFAADNVKIGFTFFRNLVLNAMADEGIRPEGMEGPINQIIHDL
ncbi:MAG: hypothetical protein EOO61_09275 [Hymenobacter sp.]|nr:MAG: hypothetical protein EOO61_09275 [Hymenobacter sp.]